MNPNAIAEAFALAVAHLIRGHPVGRSREEGGTGLAAWFGLEERTVHNRINFILDALPPDARGGQDLTRWAARLRWAKARRDLEQFAEQLGWPWGMILTRLDGLRRLA
jgi:hypothetical protein